MKTERFTIHLKVAVGGAAIFFAGHRLAAEELPPSNAVTSIMVTSGPATSTSTHRSSAAAGREFVSADWNAIRDGTYDMRVPFFAGLKRLEAKIDRQINELVAQRAALMDIAATTGWDVALQELAEARSRLRFAADELIKATAATWGPRKEKVHQAWMRMLDVCDKVRAGTAGDHNLGG